MSTTGIGSSSSVPGFDVLFPSGAPGTTPVSATNATPATASNAAANTTSTENVYQQTADSLQAWQISYLYGTLGSNSSTLPLFTDGESVDSFAQLATELGSIDTTA